MRQVPLIHKTMDNRQRVVAARKAMKAYSVAVDGVFTPTDKESAVTDMLANMMHYCGEFNMNFEAILDTAKSHYAAETGKPPAFPTEAMESPEINRELVVSTRHITKGAAIAMDSLAGEDSAMEVSPGVYLDPIKYGYRLRISEDRMLGLADDVEVELGGGDRESVDAVVALTIRYGCNRVIIDRDGPEMHVLKKYEW